MKIARFKAKGAITRLFLCFQVSHANQPHVTSETNLKTPITMIGLDEYLPQQGFWTRSKHQYDTSHCGVPAKTQIVRREIPNKGKLIYKINRLNIMVSKQVLLMDRISNLTNIASFNKSNLSRSSLGKRMTLVNMRASRRDRLSFEGIHSR